VGELPVVEDDEIVRRGLARLVRPYGEPAFAGTAREAREVLAVGAQWRGFIFDIGLPDGCGLQVLAKLVRVPSWTFLDGRARAFRR